MTFKDDLVSEVHKFIHLVQFLLLLILTTAIISRIRQQLHLFIVQSSMITLHTIKYTKLVTLTIFCLRHLHYLHQSCWSIACQGPMQLQLTWHRHCKQHCNLCISSNTKNSSNNRNDNHSHHERNSRNSSFYYTKITLL